MKIRKGGDFAKGEFMHNLAKVERFYKFNS